MQIIKNISLLLGTLGVLTGVFACSQNSTAANVALGKVTDYRPAQSRPLEKDSPAPEFQFQTPEGQNMFLSELQGKVVLLNFWSVDCPYCVKEMPLLEQAFKDWQDKGFIILAVNTGDAESRVKQFVSQRNLSFDIILDPDVYASTVYQANYLPTTYIIDKTGKIVGGQIGAFTNTDEIKTAIEPYLQ